MIYLCSGMQGQAHSAKNLDWCMMECAGSHVGKEKTINFKAPSILFTLYLCRHHTRQAFAGKDATQFAAPREHCISSSRLNKYANKMKVWQQWVENETRKKGKKTVKQKRWTIRVRKWRWGSEKTNILAKRKGEKTGDILKLLLEQQKMEAPLVQQQCAPEPEPASQSVW